jgi:hypothetical protein
MNMRAARVASVVSVVSVKDGNFRGGQRVFSTRGSICLSLSLLHSPCADASGGVSLLLSPLDLRRMCDLSVVIDE